MYREHRVHFILGNKQDLLRPTGRRCCGGWRHQGHHKSGEDYLYSAKRFVPVNVPPAVEKSLALNT